MAKQTYLKVKQPLLGVFRLSFNKGQVVKIGEGKDVSEEQADEIVNIGYGEYCDKEGNAIKSAAEKGDTKALETENAQLKEAVKGYVGDIENLKKVIQDKDTEIENSQKTREDNAEKYESLLSGKDAEIAELVEALKNSNLAVDNLKAAYAVNTSPGEDKK